MIPKASGDILHSTSKGPESLSPVVEYGHTVCSTQDGRGVTLPVGEGTTPFDTCARISVHAPEQARGPTRVPIQRKQAQI